jgi:hypothetical protein
MPRLFVLLALFACAVVALAQAPPPPPPGPCCWPPVPAGLVDWWTFDEPAGTSSSDFGGTVNNLGMDHGTIARVPGAVGRAVSLTGSTWIEIGTGNEVNFLGNCVNDVAQPFTVDFWIRTTQTNGTATILDKRSRNGTTFLRGYSVYLHNGRVGLQMATGPGNFACNRPGSACSNMTATSLPSVADGNWHFVGIAFTRCLAASGLFYVDGQVASFTPRVGDIASASNLYIGRLAPPMGNSYLTGELDELELFKAALTKSDFDSIFGKKCAGKCRAF